MSNDPYFGYIFGAYFIGFVVIAGMIIATRHDYHRLKRDLARLSERTGRAVGE